MCRTDGVCLDTITKARWTNPATGRIVRHPYGPSPHSGAGNCWCGRAELHRLHVADAQPPAQEGTR